MAGRSVLQSAANAVSSRAAVRLPRPALRGRVVTGTDVGVAGVPPHITPNADFYRVDTALVVPKLRTEGYKGLTVFAPDNSAFQAVPPSTLDSLLANKAELTKLLEYHVVAGRIPPSQLAGTHKTLAGPALTVTGSGSNFTVNGTSRVVCGNVQTANATVYIVSQVLDPASK